jgi:hypothetical protein
MSFYVTNAVGTFRVGLYDNSGANGPGTLLAQSGDVTAVNGWNTVPMPRVAVTPGTYWEYILPSSSSLAFANTNIAGDHNPFVQPQMYGPLPRTFPATTDFNSTEWSFYTTAEITGGITTLTTTTTPTTSTTTTTTPTTSTTTTTTPTTTTSSSGQTCFPSPGSCGYPDPAYGNVGVPAGTALTLNNGDLTVTTNGAVINALHVNGYILVQADNVTIENTLVTNTGTPGGFAIEEPNGYYGLTVKNSEISGNNIYMGGCDGCPNGSVDHVYMHNCGECVQYANAVTNSYFYLDASSSVYHYEAYYGSDSTVDFEHDTILNPHEQTADVFDDTGGGSGAACDNQVTINNSLLAGGGYEFYPCANSSSAGTSKVTITNNRFARCTTTPTVTAGSGYICQGIGDPTGNGDAITNPDKNGYFPGGGFFGLDAYIFCNQTTWTNNVWDDNGAAVGC